MKFLRKGYFNPQSQLESFLAFHLFMSGQMLDSYINIYNPLFPNYINLDLLKYLLSIGSNVACRIYYCNGFKDCILMLDDKGIPFSDIKRIERSSRFKIKNRFRHTGKDILVKVNLSWQSNGF